MLLNAAEISLPSAEVWRQGRLRAADLQRKTAGTYSILRPPQRAGQAIGIPY